MKLNIIFATLMALAAMSASAVQPKIMVVPHTAQGEDIREKLESDPAQRLAITEIKNAFDQRGFTTVDFLAKLKALSVQDAMNDGAQSDLKTMVIDGSGADVYVDAEIIYTESPQGNDVKMVLTSYEISTGNSLSNKTAMTNKFYTNDVAKLSVKAVNTIADDFLNIMQSKFDDMVENGRSIAITVSVDEGCPVSLGDEVGSDGTIISDLLDEWMEENAYKGNYHTQGMTAKRVIFDDVRIPLKDENGNSVSTNKFVRKFAKLFAKAGLTIERNVSNNAINIRIMDSK